MPNESSDEYKDFLIIGRLGAPFGVQGFLKVHSYSGETGHFNALKEVTLSRDSERKVARIESVVPAPGGAAVLLAGCSGPEDARIWTGWEILVPRNLAAPLHTDEYYVADLVGCVLVCGDSPAGEIVSILDGGSAPLLEVRLETGKNVLVPFQKEFVGMVDIPARSVSLLTPWILE